MIIGIGTDIVEIKRLKEKKDVLSKRILSEKEYAQYVTYEGVRQEEYLAGRFAAKEAVFKAIDKDLVISQIEILNDEKGKPICHIDGYTIHVSIAHEKEYATSYVICEK